MALPYARMINSTKRSLSINDHLIEFAQDTLQIRNLVGISVGTKPIPITDPEPVFRDPRPSLNVHWKALLIGAALVWAIIVWGVKLPAMVGWLLAAGVIGYGIYSAMQTKEAADAQWKSTQEHIAAQWQVWDNLRRNPPLLYSLKIETNSGSRSLFYSFDQTQIDQASTSTRKS